MFRLAVSGYRNFRDAPFLAAKLDALLAARLPGAVILEGGAAGADELARDYADARGLVWITFPADWKRHGKKAGPIRNSEMVANCDALVAFRAPQSIGTTDAVGKAVLSRTPVVVFDVVLDAAGLVVSHTTVNYNRSRLTPVSPGRVS